MVRLLAFLMLLGACGGTAATEAPAGTLQSYVRSVNASQADDAYELLDDRTRSEIDLERFRQLFEENQAELRDQSAALVRPNTRTVARAEVALENGETVTLVLENGRWMVDGGVLGAPTLRTPRDAVLALRNALYRRSLASVVRVLAQEPRAELEADIGAFLEDTADDLDLRVEIHGNTASVWTTNGREITLVRESGEWRILSLE
ncbi:MAG: hypothetical protein AAGF12_29965 [Myxococcota bacterium]